MENIDEKDILIEELEKELDIVRKNITVIQNSKDENLIKVQELERERNEIARKLEAIECSRSYKLIRKIKKILGGKDE